MFIVFYQCSGGKKTFFFANTIWNLAQSCLSKTTLFIINYKFPFFGVRTKNVKKFCSKEKAGRGGGELKINCNWCNTKCCFSYHYLLFFILITSLQGLHCCAEGVGGGGGLLQTVIVIVQSAVIFTVRKIQYFL